MTMISEEKSKSKTYIAYALDPIHVGTGGERLGRVDLSVVRETAPRVPKIPGTTLSGALKFFADLALRDQRLKADICASTRGSKNAHSHGTCPICCPFGYTPQQLPGGPEPKSAQGILQFTDARLLAYPVNTLLGPVWLSTLPRLDDLLNLGTGIDNGDDRYLLPEDTTISSPLADQALNFGWVVLQPGTEACPSVPDLISARLEENYAKRLVVVSEWIFENLVNDNMEIRTSVVIDPETGAASSQGLFTYEAAARGSIFAFTIIENDYLDGWQHVVWGNGNRPKSAQAMMVDYAFPGIAAVGLGGMTTRGFGRLQIKSTI